MSASHRGLGSRRTARLALCGLVLAVTVLTTGGAATAGQPVVRSIPESVFGAAPALAIEAARARLALFVAANPAPTDPSVEAPAPVDRPACPLASPDTMSGAASALNTARGTNLQFMLDPWVASTTSDPELRPDSAPAGTVVGIPIVRCDTNRPPDGQLTRPSVSAIGLVSGVSFSDVARLYNLDPFLRVRPAGIGGELVGSCLGTSDTSVCVTLWQSRSLVLGMTMDGPPSAVNTSTAGSLLTDLVPDIVDTLAVVLGAPPVCDAAAISADTGLSLLEEPICHDGWAFGSTVACASDVGCEALDVFHVESSGWVHNGSIDVRCAEFLVALGMTVVTAQEIAPICDENDPILRGGSIRPGTDGRRVAALQIALVNLGYDLPVDSRYGPLTEAAVVDFQIRNNLIVDGVAGAQTRAALGI